jgi:hypothetical protein
MRGVVCYCTAFFTHSLILSLPIAAHSLHVTVFLRNYVYAVTYALLTCVLSLDDVVPNPACFNSPTQFIRMIDAVRVFFRISRRHYHVNQRATWHHA